jgi:hypothetical protein
MDKWSQLDKLIKMSLDPPTEFPRTQCLNRQIRYREACIDYVKKTMRCVGYRDYVVSELEKLDNIEQIMAKYKDTLDNYYSGKSRDLLESDVLRDIKEVLEQE